ELAEPGRADTDLASPLPKFHARHGEHLHSFAWFVDPLDVGPMVDRLRDGGIRVIEPYGEPTGEGPGNSRSRAARRGASATGTPTWPTTGRGRGGATSIRSGWCGCPTSPPSCPT